MKTFILFLILGLCKELIAPNQCRSMIRLGDGYCGIASDCYQYAVSFEVLKYYICRRNEVGRSAITSYIPGFCPYNKPQCPLDYRVNHVSGPEAPSVWHAALGFVKEGELSESDWSSDSE